MTLEKFITLQDGKRTLKGVCSRVPFNIIDLGEIRSKRTFNAYNATGQTFNAPNVVLIDTLTGDNDTSVFTLNNGEILFSETGRYEISLKISTISTNATRSTSRSFLERDVGSGFVFVDGSEFYTYDRINTAGASSASHQYEDTFNRGDKIRLVVERETGSDNETISDGCFISISPSDFGKSELLGLGWDCGTLEEQDVHICIDAGNL